MFQDLAKSGLDPIDIAAATHPLLKLPERAKQGYLIPYCRPDGAWITDSNQYPIMYRIRLNIPDLVKGFRYTQPSSEDLAAYGLPASIPYIHPWTIELENEEFAICEGEKKTVSFMKHTDIPALGIGGCQNWRHPDGSGRVHPWITEVLRRKQVKRVTLIPDADLWRYDICRAYGTFAHQLKTEGFEVRIAEPPDKIDDFFVAGGKWADIKFVNPTELVQDRGQLAVEYGLAVEMGKDKAIVQQHTANVTILLENHPAFPRIWRNLDTGRVMLGDDPAVPDLTEMQLANHFQHNLQFNKVTPNMLRSCLQAQAAKNERSPMLEWIREQRWDGVKRLDTWLSRMWGVDQSPYTAEVGTKLLVAGLARMIQPGCKIDWMMVTTGGQGIGKTSMPSILYRGNVLMLYGEQNDKDLHMKLHSALCIVIDELDSFTKKETSFWKSLITTCEDRFRPPYGAAVGVYPRRCLLYGTANKHDFLVYDASGYRRYAPIKVGEMLKFNELEEEVGQLWAEALQLYEQGGIRYWEIHDADRVSKSHVAPNADEDMVDKFLEAWCVKQSRFYDEKEGNWRFKFLDLMVFLGQDRGMSPAKQRDFADILRHRGCERDGPWWVVKRA